MKKEYTKPAAEKIEFDYKIQTGSSGPGVGCDEMWSKEKGTIGGCNDKFNGYDN